MSLKWLLAGVCSLVFIVKGFHYVYERPYLTSKFSNWVEIVDKTQNPPISLAYIAFGGKGEWALFCSPRKVELSKSPLTTSAGIYRVKEVWYHTGLWFHYLELETK